MRICARGAPWRTSLRGILRENERVLTHPYVTCLREMNRHQDPPLQRLRTRPLASQHLVHLLGVAPKTTMGRAGLQMNLLLLMLLPVMLRVQGIL